MATAYEHFERAELLVEAAEEELATVNRDTFDSRITAVRASMAVALVHATLAHAAALGANEKPGVPVPSPRSLDPRRNRKGYKNRKSTNDEGPAVASAEPNA